MIQLAGLWKKESKDGKTYYAGTLGGGRLLLFKNDRKETENHPDLVLYFAEEKGKGKRKKETIKEDKVPF
jgi:hypothetical protein